MSAVVLNVDDNLDDVLLLKRACHKADAKFDVKFVEDGEFAIEYMKGHAPYNDRSKHPIPNLILLDLNMPRKTGFEVLEWLKANAEFRKIPVAIFTSSTNTNDIRDAVSRGADCYLEKPLNYENLIVLMERIDSVLRNRTVPISIALAELPGCCAAADGFQRSQSKGNSAD
ncbi:MAG TPA: response regulator [Candidatus Limnocylindria bacterium]|nr:response regulator [Candidatus Limnocylindria bacterium]